MGKPARSRATVSVRRDGSLYSSQRARARDAKPGDKALPTTQALDQYGDDQRRADNRRLRLKRSRR